MIRHFVCVIAAMAGCSLNSAVAQTPAPGAEPYPSAQSQNSRQSLPGGNPLWGIAISELTATRERPIFSISRRPPPPPAPLVPVVEAPPPPPPPPEHCPFTLVGTALGKPESVALVLDQNTKNLVRLHVGETASGWSLRSVDLRTTTLEKNNQVVTLSLPVPGQPAAPAPALALAGRISREF